VIHVLKTSRIFYSLSMMHHLKEKDILLRMTQKYPFISILTEIMNKKLLACLELFCDKNASKVWFVYSCM